MQEIPSFLLFGSIPKACLLVPKESGDVAAVLFSRHPADLAPELLSGLFLLALFKNNLQIRHIRVTAIY